MDNSLDRLKALHSKLEEKLSEKKKAGSTSKGRKGSTGFGAVLSEKESTISSAKQESEKSPAAESDSSALEEALHRQIVRHLRIDARREPVRSENLARFTELYLKLDIQKKVPDFENIFIYKAMNISGIGLKEEDFGLIRAGKYIQIIAITYEPDKNGKKKAKNISLGYFGKAEALVGDRKNEVVEFVLRWRYEKAFQNLEHYRLLLEKVLPKEKLA